MEKILICIIRTRFETQQRGRRGGGQGGHDCLYAVPMANHGRGSVNLKLPRLKEAGVAEEMSLKKVQGDLIRQLHPLS